MKMYLRLLQWGFYFVWSTFSVVCAEEVGDVRNVYFTQTIESLKRGHLLKHTIWLKDDKFRMEYMQDGQLFVMIIVADKLYTYLPSRQFGTVTEHTEDDLDNYQIKPEMMQSATKLKDYLMLMQAEKVGQEYVGDKNCDIFQFKDIYTSNVNTLWISIEDKFPLKSQTKLVGDILTIHYTDISFDLDFKDELFVVPDSVRIENLQITIKQES